MRAISLQMLVLGCAALLVGGGCAHAPERSTEPPAPPAAATPPHAQLEAIFWSCDYLATTRGMDATPVRECAAATRELRRVKFDGSFQKMLAWWRENKPAEHDRQRAERNDPRL